MAEKVGVVGVPGGCAGASVVKVWVADAPSPPGYVARTSKVWVVLAVNPVMVAVVAVVEVQDPVPIRHSYPDGVPPEPCAQDADAPVCVTDEMDTLVGAPGTARVVKLTDPDDEVPETLIACTSKVWDVFGVRPVMSALVEVVFVQEPDPTRHW